MIEGEYNRDVERLAQRFAGEEKKISDEAEHLASIRDRKLAELEEDFVTVDRELKELKPLKVVNEATYHEWSLHYGHLFDADIGAGAIQKLLQRINLEETIKLLEESLDKAVGAKKDRLMRRLKLLRSLYKNHIRPEWMILQVIPVIPPDLRPMVALDGGRFATSDLNDLYRRVINRNNRLNRLRELNAPEVIARNEKRMLQEAVDSLIDNNARHSKTVLAATGKKRQLKSLADFLKGKQGRFRQNLLGKRIDYSGRSVIVVGPHLRMNQCGLPKTMAMELFKPFVIAKLIEREFVHNIRSANRFIESDRPETWDILEEITRDAYVLLNRAPTLHRLGIQAFQPVLIEGKAIQIHPLVCDAFNADFDGDQMAVHVPLTEEAKNEARDLMMAVKNLLKPAHGSPVATPGRDLAWAAYCMSMAGDKPEEKEMKAFASVSDALYAFETKKIGLREWLRLRGSLKAGMEDDDQITVTTIGRVIVNRVIPAVIPFMNQPFGRKELANIIRTSVELEGQEKTAVTLDAIKDLCFRSATLLSYSFGMADLPDLPGKQELLDEGEARIHEVDNFFSQGLLTQAERHNSVVKIWNEIKDRVSDMAKKALIHDGPVFTLIESGARGSWGQFTQMVGMKGLVTNPAGEIIELPVKRSFKEGFNVLEFFISSHGVRKGLSDTALRTANAGYLTRRLVDVAQDVVVREVDCGDRDGVVLTKAESDEIGEPLLVRILGRVALSDIKLPGGRKVLVKAGELITEEPVRAIENSGKDLLETHVRSVMTCKSRHGVCQQCYGYDLAFNKIVKLGTSVGIMAAQSIGEPGTQLTMRTFHTGGVAGKDITQGLPRVEELFEARNPKLKAVMSEVSGKAQIETIEREIVQVGTGKQIVDTRSGQKIVRIVYSSVEDQAVAVGKSSEVKVRVGDKILPGDVLAEKTNGTKILAEKVGTVSAVTRGIVKFVTESQKAREYIIPAGYSLIIKDGDEVQAGDPLTDGGLDLQILFKYKGQNAVQRYLSKEIQFVYASQGQKLNNKHIELIIKQMFSRVRIVDPGETELLPGEITEKNRFLDENDRVRALGLHEATADQIFLGITKVSLSTESWLSAASFQETARVLINASVTGKIDKLAGLKENVIIGRLIPAGTGFGHHECEEDDEGEVEVSQTEEDLEKAG
jgi:DNA-directed RNA polymerase subunit beta'